MFFLYAFHILFIYSLYSHYTFVCFHVCIYIFLHIFIHISMYLLFLYIFSLFYLFVSLLTFLLDVTLQCSCIYLLSLNTLLHFSHLYFSASIFVYSHNCIFLYFYIFIIVYFHTFRHFRCFIFFVFFILIFLWFMWVIMYHCTCDWMSVCDFLLMYVWS